MGWWSNPPQKGEALQVPPEEHQRLLPVVGVVATTLSSSNNGLMYGGCDDSTQPVQHESLSSQQNHSQSTLFVTTTTTTTTTLPFFHMVALLSTAFAYGCIFTTLFVITLPIECERIQQQQQQQQQQQVESNALLNSSSYDINNNGSDSSTGSMLLSKSTLLGLFVAIAGLTQLISPFIGYMSDTYIPPQLIQHPTNHPTTTTTTNSTSTSTVDDISPKSSSPMPQYAEVGQRLPYYILGAMLATTGLMGQMMTSYSAWWIHYSFAFIFSMIGLNIQYAMMLALLPDQISSEQIGIANGILAFLLVTGSIFGFTLFHVLLYQDSIESMYGLYASIVILTSILTSLYAHERDAEISAQRIQLLHCHSQHSADVKVEESKSKPEGDHIITKDADRNYDNHSVSVSSNRRAALWHVKAGVVTKKVVRGAVKKAQQMVVTPTIILRSMIAPIHRLNYYTLIQCYTIDVQTNYNFLIVTLSRLFYYCGMSIQTFFLYYIHDIIQIPPHENPETIVAILAMIGQCSGALTCYPVGIVSDRLLHGQRKPFIYVACIILSAATFSFIYARTVHHMIIICTILGAANGMYLTAETSLAVDTLTSDNNTVRSRDDTASTNNHDRTLDHSAGSAQLLGIWGVAAFVGSALGPLIGGPLLGAFGTITTATVTSNSDSLSHHHHSGATYTEVDTTAYTITGYTVILSLSSFYFVCSAVILQFLKVDKKVITDRELSEERN